MKLCKKCNTIKPTSEFSKNIAKPDGLQQYCKDCHRRQTKDWSLNNPVKRRESSNSWYKRNPEKNREKFKQWYQKNKDKHQALCAMRRRWVLKASTAWREESLIRCIYRFAEALRGQGFPAEVDHIVPIRHPDCCGLHSASNLGILKKQHNARKGNKCMSYYTPAVLDPLFWTFIELEGLDTGGLTINDYQ